MGWISPTPRPQPLRAAPPRPQPGQNEDLPTSIPVTDNPDLPTPGPGDHGIAPTPNSDVPPSRPTDPDFA